MEQSCSICDILLIHTNIHIICFKITPPTIHQLPCSLYQHKHFHQHFLF
nr:MAG TPA: hypothetical protein [Caudoviricetes sp.]